MLLYSAASTFAAAQTYDPYIRHGHHESIELARNAAFGQLLNSTVADIYSHAEDS